MYLAVQPLAKKIEVICVGICAALLVAIVSLTFTQVICRYLLARPLIWSEEITRLCFVWLVFLGAAILSGRGELLSISLAEDAMSRAGRRLMERLWAAFGVIFFFALSLASVDLMRISMGQVSPTTGLPAAVNYCAPLIGALVGMLLSAARVLARLNSEAPK